MTTATDGLWNAKVYRYTYADAATREADTGLTSDDVHSLALQEDDNTLWQLLDTTPTWTQFGGGMANPMTTPDDLIVGGTGGAATRVAKGGNNTVFGVDGSGVLGYKADPSSGGVWAAIGSPQTLGSAQASVTFSSIPGTYRLLRLIAAIRGDAAAAAANLLVRCNGDTAGNYDYTNASFSPQFGVNQAQAFAATAAQMSAFPTAGAGVSQTRSQTMIDFIGYATTSYYKSMREVGGWHYTTATNGSPRINLAAGNWRSTAAVTSITVLPDSGNFAAGSEFALYGLT